jgi:hypothetical protein
VNVGTNLVLPTVFEDLDNIPRPQGSAYDIGCYEFTGTTEVVQANIPKSFKLFQNYPNPFNPTTKIEFQLANSGFVSLKVYNVLGNEIKTLLNKEMSAGNYEVTFDGSEFSSGIYFVRLEQDSFIQTIKMTLMR